MARARWLFKPAPSALFLVFAWLQGPRDAYDAWIVAGLALSAAGNVLLIPAGRRWFTAGLVAFLLGHVAYVLAFATLVPPWALHPAAAAVIVAASAGAWLYLRPFLGPMRAPVLAYVAVITVMVLGACSVAAIGGGVTVAVAARSSTCRTSPWPARASCPARDSPTASPACRPITRRSSCSPPPSAPDPALAVAAPPAATAATGYLIKQCLL